MDKWMTESIKLLKEDAQKLFMNSCLNRQLLYLLTAVLKKCSVIPATVPILKFKDTIRWVKQYDTTSTVHYFTGSRQYIIMIVLFT